MDGGRHFPREISLEAGVSTQVSLPDVLSTEHCYGSRAFSTGLTGAGGEENKTRLKRQAKAGFCQALTAYEESWIKFSV